MKRAFLLLAILLLTLASSVTFSASKAWSATTVTVNPTIQYQTLEGWGTSLAWFANVIGGAPEAVRNNYADLLFDGTTGLGLNVARYNIGGGENPQYLPPNTTYLQYRARVPGYEPSAGTFDWTADANQRWFLQAAMSRGANQLEAFSNSPPYWMTNSGSVTGSATGSGDNLNPAYYDAFADYLSAVAQHFLASWGVTFRTVEPVNEPVADWWKFTVNTQEGSHFDRSSQNTIIKKLGASLATKGVPAAVAASDEFNIDDTYASFLSYDSTALSYLSKVNTHSYAGTNRTGVQTAADGRGKAVWMSEYGDDDATGLTMSQQIVDDMKNLQPTAWVYWQAVDHNSAPGWGMITTDLNNPTNYAYTVNEKYYVMKNYSKFLRPGYKFIYLNDSHTLAAYDKRSNTLVIVTTNATGSDLTTTYDLSKFSSITGTVTPYRTSASEKLAQLPPISVVNQSFTGIAKANSVTTYVVGGANYNPAVSATINDNMTGPGLNQVNYTGTWSYFNTQAGAYMNDNHWSGNAGDTYTVAFNGSQALIYAAKDSNEGIAAVSIDNGPETEVDLYAASRSDNQFVYSTPTLPSSAHTLKVRVTGRKNPASSFTYVPADRIDIVAGSNTFDPNARYRIISRNSGQVANVNGSSTTPGAQIIQWYDNGGNNTLWTLSSASGGYYKLINVNSGLVLDVNGASLANGANVIQWNDNGGANQQWSIVPVSGNYFKIVNRNSGLDLDVSGASITGGANVIQWSDNGGSNQMWSIMKVQ
ncbi:glycoside hydrolase [Paenibacillus sp. GCM10027628]|uniref:glycoside hydrolase n=1 Tax=Paenibacillus sp. GCM10027628 TaxID=3273413 RepID=UPI00363430C2